MKNQFSITYLPELSVFMVMEHEVNGSNSPIYFNNKQEAEAYVASLD